MKPKATSDQTRLRHAAEARLEQRSAGSPPLNEMDLRRLQHELQVHQIELEMQNEELRAAQMEIEAGLERYTDLYDFAPIGYFNLSANGTIELVNLTGAKLAGIERGRLLGRRFGLFVAESDRHEFNAFLDRVFASETRQDCELTLAVENQPALVLQLEATLSANSKTCLAVMMDITERKRSGAELKRQHALLTAVVEGTSDAVFAKDLAGRYQIINTAGAQAFGKTVAEVIGCTDAEITSPAAARQFSNTDQEVIASGQRVTREEMAELPDGTVHFRANKAPWRDLAGNIIGIIGVSHDITAFKEAEAALRESQTHLTALMNSVDGIVWELDAATFQFTFVSPSAERLLGYPLAQWTADPTFWADHIHPDDREQAVGYCMQCIRAKQDHEFTYRMVAADGRSVWMRDIVTLVMENGEPVKLRGIMTDITAHRQAEAERERLLNVLEASLNEIYIFDAETWRFQYVNDCARRHLGYSMEEMRELTPLDLKPQLDLASFAALVAPLRRHEKEQIVFESMHRCADGRLYPVEVHLQLVEHGGSTVFLAIINDITERQQAEQQQQEASEQLRALMTRLRQAREEERVRVSREIHDELGQLLTGLKMDVRWLERKLSEPGLPPALNPLLDRVVAASELTDVTIATVQKIAAELRPGALDQLGLAAALAQEARRFQARSGVQCVVSGDDSWPMLPPNVASELFYIAQEALTNVARHAQAGQIEIRLSVEGSEAVLEVCDDGVGMDTAAKRKSSSLGLLGMEERAAQCGGTVSFSRNTPQGLCVMVRVPMTNDERSGKRDENSTGG